MLRQILSVLYYNMSDITDAFAIELDSEIINQDIDEVDLYAERIVEDSEYESDIDFDY